MEMCTVSLADRNATLSRRGALALLALGSAQAMGLADARAEQREARDRAPGSSYGFEFGYPPEELVGDLQHTERGNPHDQSETPHRDWYSHWARHHLGAWGPKPRHYPLLPGLAARPVEWKRQRVIATAARFIGYDYQHHHIPDWNPPPDWPWKECCAGQNGRGVDCSNFTSFVYNQGFGIKITSAVARQSQLRGALTADGYWPLARVELPHAYHERVATLRTGDLLYVRGRVDGPITHVVLWVGSIGRADDSMPLVLDSHGSGVDDEGGRAIPCGIYLRPFREHSWYNRCASHAHRVFAG